MSNETSLSPFCVEYATLSERLVRPPLTKTFPADLGRRLSPIHAEVPDIGPFQQAAVLALIDSSESGDRLVLIERPSDLSVHGGQLAFPGGKPEPGDRDLLHTALRETEEEIGLEASKIQILGRLEPVPTPSMFLIVPFVGKIVESWTPRPAPAEVAQVLRPSVHTLCDPTTHQIRGAREWRGVTYELHEFAIHEPPLWGATARMVWELLQRGGLLT